MRPNARLRASASLLIVFLGAAPGSAAAPKPTVIPPAIPLGEPHTLGVLGAKGFLRPEDNPSTLIISEVDDGSIAGQAGLKPGDKIIGVDPKGGVGQGVFKSSPKEPRPIQALKNTESPLIQMMKAMLAATPKGKSLGLMVDREGKVEVLKCAMPDGKAHDKCLQGKCPRCAATVQEALDFLASDQAPFGPPGYASTVEVSVRGLAFLAEGSTLAAGQYQAPLCECVRQVASYGGFAADAPAHPMSNWTLGFGGLFLAEVYARFGDDALRIAQRPAEGNPGWDEATCGIPPLSELLKGIADKIAAGQEASGAWGHGGAPGVPNMMGYIDVQGCANWNLAALGRMRQCGIPLPSHALEKGLAYARSCVSGKSAGPGICYSCTGPQKDLGNPQLGRTASGIFAFWCADQASDPTCLGMAKYYEANLKQMPFGHSARTMHFLACGLAGYALPGMLPKFWDDYLPKMESVHMADGTFALWPSDVGNDPKTTGRAPPEAPLLKPWPVSVHALLMQLHKGLLFQPVPKGAVRKRGTRP
jgi:hypothetical protein